MDGKVQTTAAADGGQAAAQTKAPRKKKLLNKLLELCRRADYTEDRTLVVTLSNLIAGGAVEERIYEIGDYVVEGYRLRNGYAYIVSEGPDLCIVALTYEPFVANPEAGTKILFVTRYYAD
jgi:hypothetical protein